VVCIAALNETQGGEKRVALTPEMVKKYHSHGHKVILEKGAGVASFFPDQAYTEAGAHIVTRAAVLKESNVLLTLGNLKLADWKKLAKKTFVVGLLGELSDETTAIIEAHKLHIFDLERLPRVSRAQTMDILSSQSTITGYASVILAAQASSSLFPLLMTSAGTLSPQRVLVLGAGVAGLQAIATAKRLGAHVTAYDIRPDARDQVTSLGANFLEIALHEENTETKDGYAKEVSKTSQKAQQEALKKAFTKTDSVITTALIPHKKAPLLITKQMLNHLKPGSVVVDLAAERGGNCEVTVPGQTIIHEGIKVLGALNVASLHAKDASRFYAKNLFHFTELLFTQEGTLRQTWDDDILKATYLSQNAS